MPAHPLSLTGIFTNLSLGRLGVVGVCVYEGVGEGAQESAQRERGEIGNQIDACACTFAGGCISWSAHVEGLHKESGWTATMTAMPLMKSFCHTIAGLFHFSACLIASSFGEKGLPQS